MSSLVMSAPAPGWLRELADARAEYQELLGWPVSVQVSQQSLVVAVGRVLGAVTMPAVLGARVRGQLGESILAAPILANSAGTRWTFLGRPTTSTVEGLPALQVRPAPAGSYVVIPPGLGGEGWVERPVPNRALPSTGELVALARRLRYDGCLGRSA